MKLMIWLIPVMKLWKTGEKTWNVWMISTADSILWLWDQIANQGDWGFGSRPSAIVDSSFSDHTEQYLCDKIWMDYNDLNFEFRELLWFSQIRCDFCVCVIIFKWFILQSQSRKSFEFIWKQGSIKANVNGSDWQWIGRFFSAFSDTSSI